MLTSDEETNVSTLDREMNKLELGKVEEVPPCASGTQTAPAAMDAESAPAKETDGEIEKSGSEQSASDKTALPPLSTENECQRPESD